MSKHIEGKMIFGVIGLLLIMALSVAVRVQPQRAEAAIELPQPCLQYDTLIRGKKLYACPDGGKWVRIVAPDNE